MVVRGEKWEEEGGVKLTCVVGDEIVVVSLCV